MKRAYLMAACLALTTQAEAGDFSLSWYGPALGRPVSQLIADVVSDDFTTAFPGDKYEIVVIHEHTQAGNDNICYATVGVAKRHKDNEISSVPAWRFNSTRIDRNTGGWNTAKIRDCLSSVIHTAVENMMSIPAKEIKEKSKL